MRVLGRENDPCGTISGPTSYKNELNF